MVAYADWKNIDAQINHIYNRVADGTFTHLGDTGVGSDTRYSDAAVTEARRKAAYRIFNALAKDLTNPYWGQLKTDVLVTSGSAIPPHYGEIGIPLISLDGRTYRTGRPAEPDEIDSYLADELGTFSNVYGSRDKPVRESYGDRIMSPMALRYSTSGGVFIFTGSKAKIPMIKKPETQEEVENMADNMMPYEYADLNVKLALPLLLKEGDNSLRIVTYLGQEGERELINLSMGRAAIAPVNPTRMIQLAQQNA